MFEYSVARLAFASLSSAWRHHSQPSTARVPARPREIAPLLSGTRAWTVELAFKMSLRRGFDVVVYGERHHQDDPVKVGELAADCLLDVALMESIVMTVFAMAAVAGFKSTAWIVVAGLAAHGVFDALHGNVVNSGVPVWWPAFCLAYDLGAAGGLAWLIKRQPRGMLP